MKEVELLKCPFCGGEAELHVTKHIPNGYDYTPRCKIPSCCGRITKKFNVKETAILFWNRRA
ncbi:MAG: Lar family restriction alleviation protein [Bacteroidaceae bacterium]|nr:Lar family restriction alleviation protein [Bacteroidaceae bacterium]